MRERGGGGGEDIWGSCEKTRATEKLLCTSDTLMMRLKFASILLVATAGAAGRGVAVQRSHTSAAGMQVMAVLT